MSEANANSPVHTIRSGPMTLSLWENRTEREGRTILQHSATLNKRYRDKSGEWRDTQTLFAQDLYRLMVLAQRAAEWIDLKEQDPADSV